MAQIPVTYVRVSDVRPERREAFGHSLGGGLAVYIDYKERASFVPDAEIRLGVVLGGELIRRRKKGWAGPHSPTASTGETEEAAYALRTYRCFSDHELRMLYVQRVVANGH